MNECKFIDGIKNYLSLIQFRFEIFGYCDPSELNSNHFDGKPRNMLYQLYRF